ncbi:hypothetical protein NQ317_000529 [Molorchus minor]|uniref:Phospholipase A2-like domain-containing protein n=1 Tax=Molorchus minor TaxID=1323400 RepID=A0ABQ9J8W7_9CUCU|nr:hypothetical protein NQ317_000529 [Molorchus minor]
MFSFIKASHGGVMIIHTTIHKRKRVKTGSGFVNNLINNLPFELHIPGYNFCGPGTKLYKRLARGDTGVNPLDEACKEHDIAYSRSKDISNRHEADKVLAEKAYQRFKARDSSIGEKISALSVTGVMKAKTKLGMGMRRKKRTNKKSGRGVRKGTITFDNAVQRARHGIQGGNSLIKNARQALSSIGNKNISLPKKRIIPIPKTGGFLPFLIPIFAALSALGSIGGGAAGIAKAVNDAKAAKQKLEEDKRHNLAMEQATVGKGLYLRPYKKGMGLYLAPYKKNSQ